MKIKCVKVGMLETNCYIVENKDKCLIIDPGDDFDKISRFIDKDVVGVLITHKHFDHVGALEEVLSYYKTDVYCMENLKEGNNVIGDIRFDVIYNPGHTKDSISFLFDNSLFCGDFVFKGTIGRCDLGGDFNLMMESIKKLLDTECNYEIYPGHGEFTFLDDEREELSSWLK